MQCEPDAVATLLTPVLLHGHRRILARPVMSAIDRPRDGYAVLLDAGGSETLNLMPPGTAPVTRMASAWKARHAGMSGTRACAPAPLPPLIPASTQAGRVRSANRPAPRGAEACSPPARSDRASSKMIFLAYLMPLFQVFYAPHASPSSPMPSARFVAMKLSASIGEQSTN